MGVYGLWKLLEASGKPVPLETLEGKVLAIDISIWIYQVLQGYQDRHGTPRPNAHLLGLFIRICKLLYYKIKPVFVFDGGVPMLKKNTIASRRKQKSIATSKAQKMKADLINNLIKHSVVKTVLSKDSKVDENSGATRIMINLQTKRPDEDMFILPDMPGTSDAQAYISDDDDNVSDTSVELSPRKQSKWIGNIHSVDVASNEFKSLPADVRYDILTDLKETRKQNSWGRLHEMPQETHEFSGFQLKRLLKRRYVQESLESAEKEMGGKTLTLEELEKLLIEQGIDTKGREAAFRIAADSTTRLIYISDKNALAKSVNNNELGKDECDTLREANEEEFEPVAGPSNLMPNVENTNDYKLNDDSDDDDVYIYNDSMPIAENMNEYALDSDWESECDNDVNESLALLSEKYLGTNKTNPALTYMLEYSGLSQKQIVQLLKHNKDESREKTSKNVKVPEKDIPLEFAKDEKMANNKSKVGLSENCEKISQFTQLQIHAQDACTTNDDTNVELISSKQKLDVIEIEPSKDTEISEVTSNTINKTTLEKPAIAKFNDETQIDSSDSDSDDFIEIQDVPIPDVEIPRNIVKKENIEIIFKSDEKPEEDMFADIFEEASKNGVTPINHLEQLLPNTNAEHKTLLISEDSNNLKNSLLDTIPEEPVVEEKEIKSLENTSLTKNSANDEDKAHNSQSSNEPIELNKTSSLAQGNSCIQDNECIQEKPVTLPANEEGLIELKEKLENEQEELTRDIGKLERQATNISDQIKIEAQELLRLFGIPYIVAPMEAEAQCAYLEQIKLTDGTITDDSDIWLFGGECVYKNFFNNNKKVLQFRACDIQHHFKLSRNQLIQLALLVGSDYTTGVTGIGPVTALEILAAFPAEGDNVLHGLHNFCSWIKKGRIAAPGKTGLRNKLRNVKLERDFPSQAVVQAYLFPTIDESKETFTWGKPNMVLLCDYTRQKFGWTKGKFDDTMIPVLRRLEENKNQKLLDMYFKAKASTRSIEPSLSKRVQKAVRKLNNDDIEEANVDGEPQAKKSKKSDANQKSSKEENAVEPKVSTSKPPNKISTTPDKPVKSIIEKIYTKEYIPQREKDKACALERKLHAIEIFRKSKQGLAKTKKVKYTMRKVKKEAELSESDSN